MTAIGRREFLAALGAASAAGTDVLSGFATAAKADITWGYASITWQGNDRQAIEDVAACGYRGIQLRSNVLAEFGGRPADLKEILERNGLQFVALSSGVMRIDPSVEREDLEAHVERARFVKALGGSYLQLVDERPKRPLTAADFKRMGRLLTDLGKRTADLGVTVSYHNHMNNLGERPEEVRAVMDASDPKLVKFQLDTAHYQQGGGDPAAAVREYRDRLSFLHVKDLEAPLPGATGDPSRSYRFVELGRGKVDLKKVLAALDEIGFKGWCVVELDRVPDNARTPKESALISRTYIEKELGRSVGPPPMTAAPGWTPLFDGKTLNGWRGYKRSDASGTRWRVENGMLTVSAKDGQDTRGALDLITTATYDQFELAWEWRVSPGGNSGVKYFVVEDRDAAIGHEYQIIDDQKHPDALIGPERQTGSFYDVLAATSRPARPVGEFNESRVIVTGNHVEHWLNGTRVLTYELGSSALQAAVQDSKFKDVARFGTRQKGHVLVQDHGDAVWYRNIRIRPIAGS